MDKKFEPLVRIVDNDESLLDALRFMLLSEGWHVTIYSNAEDFFKKDDCTQPGCIVLDYQMPSMNGLEAQELLLRKGYTQPILFLTAHAHVDMAIRAFKRGALDLLKKPVQAKEFLEAIAKAVEMDLAQRHASPSVSYQELYESLTSREKQVLSLVTAGLMNCQIADRLNVSERTVEAHRASAYKRLAVRNLSELKRFMTHLSKSAGPD